MSERGKQFFFEKKNQKTFANLASGLGRHPCWVAKVFASFFKKKRFLAVFALLVGPLAHGQGPAPHRASPAVSDNPFAVVPWFAIQPQNTYQAAPANGVDLSVHDSGSEITVYEDVRRRKRDLGRRFDLGSPLFNDAATPFQTPTGVVGGACSGEAYRTVGGQAAKGGDLIGGLGAGRCD